jgi:hypothetical protein
MGVGAVEPVVDGPDEIFPAERERKSIILLEGSQATPARPSGRNNVKVRTLW